MTTEDVLRHVRQAQHDLASVADDLLLNPGHTFVGIPSAMEEVGNGLLNIADRLRNRQRDESQNDVG